jgi:hypothetical protein
LGEIKFEWVSSNFKKRNHQKFPLKKTIKKKLACEVYFISKVNGNLGSSSDLQPTLFSIFFLVKFAKFAPEI